MFWVHFTIDGITYLRFARSEKEVQELCDSFEYTFWHEPKVIERKVA